jgi:hypothetical protein
MSTCYAVQDPTFQPAMRIISAITNAANAAVTTTFDHDYESGLIVRLVVPEPCGMQQINHQKGTITVTGATTFTIDIDSTLYDTFSIPGSPDPHDNTCALVVPIGEINSELKQATRNVLP